MNVGWGWVAMGFFSAVGCAPSAMGGVDDGGGTMGDEVDASSTSLAEAEAEADGDPSVGTSADYPTHDSCEDSGAGYDVPYDDDDDGSTGSAEESGAGMVDDIPIGATVFQVREGYVPAGTFVEVQDLVITSPTTRQTFFGPMVFAQSPEGGPHSAIALMLSNAVQVPDLAVGDRVRVRGHVGVRYVFSALFFDHVDASILVEGTAALPVPVVLAPSDLQPGAENAEAYESALVRVVNPQVDDAPSCVGSFTLDAGVRVDDLFLGDAAPNPAAGDSFSAITGPLRYTYNGFEIAPRSAADIEP